MQSGAFHDHLMEDCTGLYISALIRSGDDEALRVIEDVNGNVTVLTLNGESPHGFALTSQFSEDRAGFMDMGKWLKGLSLQELMDLLDGLDADDLQFLKEGIELNFRLPEARFRQRCSPFTG